VSGPGKVVARIRDYEVARLDAEGLAEDAVLQVGSISKPVAALVALRLVEDGVLSLDADVNERLTTWRASAPVTLRQLLSHTGGVGVEWFPGHPNGGPAPTLLEVLDGVPPSNTEPVRVDPAAQGAYRYSGGGYAIVQQLVEDATGTPFAAVADERVLRPLGMHDSTFEQEVPAGLRGRVVNGYRDGEPVDGGWHVYPAATAAGLWTTANDLGALTTAIQRSLAGRSSPISRTTAVAMLTPQAEVPPREEWTEVRALGVEPPQESGLGLKLSLDGLRFGHWGSNAGFTAAMDASATDGSGALVVSNSDRGFAEVLPTLAAAL
jgi:CubicO group peptidase (beta-lactamase class C family)